MAERRAGAQNERTRTKSELPLFVRQPIFLGAVTGILVCVVGFALLQLNMPKAAQPQPIARALCTQLETHDYAGAYGALSAHLRSVGTQAQFISSQRELDIVQGAVTQCAYTVTSQDSGQALMTFSVSRTKAGGRTGTVRLVLEGDAWKIDDYDASVV